MSTRHYLARLPYQLAIGAAPITPAVNAFVTAIAITSVAFAYFVAAASAYAAFQNMRPGHKRRLVKYQGPKPVVQ